MTDLVALLIVTNLVCKPCPYCDVRPDGWDLPPDVSFAYPVVHEHFYEAVVSTNYLPVVVDPRKECQPSNLPPLKREDIIVDRPQLVDQFPEFWLIGGEP